MFSVRGNTQNKALTREAWGLQPLPLVGEGLFPLPPSNFLATWRSGVRKGAIESSY